MSERKIFSFFQVLRATSDSRVEGRRDAVQLALLPERKKDDKTCRHDRSCIVGSICHSFLFSAIMPMLASVYLFRIVVASLVAWKTWLAPLELYR